MSVLRHYPDHRSIKSFFSLLLAGSISALAQDSTASSDDSVVVLNPFEVNTSKDNGFVAASSLAGGRLAGNLRDTPVAYSVLTKDFIDALDLRDLNDMAKWATNSYNIPDNGTGEVTGNSVVLASRGVSASPPQRNFFPVSFNFDSYNIERLDLARGPNAILFGSSSIGGVANSVTKRAMPEKEFTETRTSYGSWGNFRFTLDENLPLNKDVAVRVNALYNDRKGWRDRDYERRKAVTLAATWRILKNTEIRVEGEVGRTTKAVITTNFDDWFSAWDGKTTFSGRIGAPIPAQGVTFTGNNPYAVFTPSAGLTTLTNYQGWALTTGGNQSALYPVGGKLVVGSSANVWTNPITEQLNLPANLYDAALKGSHFTIPSRSFATSLDSPLYTLTNQNYTLAITQRIGDHFFAEVAGNIGREDVKTDLSPSRGLSQVWIDVNSLLPDGKTNPNFLQPFGESRSFPFHQIDDKTNARASLAYVLDRTRFGDFQFNVLAGISRDDLDRNAFQYVEKLNADPRQWPTADWIRYRYYFNTDGSRPLPRPDTWTYVDPISGTSKTVPAGDVRDYTNTSFNQISKIDYKYIQVAATGKLLKGRLNLIAAMRRDNYTTHQSGIVSQFDNPTNWDGTTRYLKPDAPSDWSSLTYRLRDANGNPVGAPLAADTRPRIGGLRDPKYANDRFRDDYSPPDSKDTVDTHTVGLVGHATDNISFFANYAESFIPPQQQFDIYGNSFKPAASSGRDYGLRFTLLHGNVVANISYYQGRERQRPISNNGNQADLSLIINAHAFGDYSPGAKNIRGLENVPIGYTDSTEAKTHGWELELTANLTPNWRLTFNAALPEAYQLNPYAQTIAYLKANDATLRQIIVDAGGSFNGNVASFTPSAPVNDSSGAQAVLSWNNIQSRLASVVSQPQKLTRLTEGTANLYTDYAFRRGLLKGFRFGGGVNYRGRQVIGYKGADTIRDPSNPSVAIDDPRVGPLDPVYMNRYASATLTSQYSHKIGKRYTFTIDFKIDNLFNYSEPIYYSTILRPPGGDVTNPARVATPQRFSWLTPRTYTGSATLKF